MTHEDTIQKAVDTWIEMERKAKAWDKLRVVLLRVTTDIPRSEEKPVNVHGLLLKMEQILKEQQ